MRKQECSKTVIAIIVGCLSIFAVGITLLSLGFMAYRSEPPPPPYVYSLSTCPLQERNFKNSKFPDQWFSSNLSSKHPLCDPEITAPVDQLFFIPKNVLDEGIKYQLVVYVTNNVDGKIKISHRTSDDTLLFHDEKQFRSMKRVDFAYCGGKELAIYRDVPDENNIDGDLISGVCNDTVAGCIYEPARSLNSFEFPDSYNVIDIPEGGSMLEVELTLKSTEVVTSPINPDVFVEFRIAGLGVSQKKGLILMIIGGIMADLMPASLFFLLQHFYFKKPSPVSDDMVGMIPLMEM